MELKGVEKMVSKEACVEGSESTKVYDRKCFRMDRNIRD